MLIEILPAIMSWWVCFFKHFQFLSFLFNKNLRSFINIKIVYSEHLVSFHLAKILSTCKTCKILTKTISSWLGFSSYFFCKQNTALKCVNHIFVKQFFEVPVFKSQKTLKNQTIAHHFTQGTHRVNSLDFYILPDYPPPTYRVTHKGWWLNRISLILNQIYVTWQL